MAGSLEQVLASMPGLSGYLAKKQFDNQQSNQELQGLAGGMGLLQQIQARQEQEHAKNALAQTGGDPQKAAEALLKSGNYRAAASLAPLMKAQTDASQPKFAPSRSPGYFQNGKWVATPENVPPTKPAEPDHLTKLITARDALPQEHPNRKVYDQAIQKLSTHQPAVNVYSGSLTAGVDAEGKPIFAQPSGRPDTPPRIVQGVYPPPSVGEKKETEKRAESEATIQSVRQRVTKMSAIIQGNAGVTGPVGMARRVGETAVGVVAPGIQTPAIDLENEKNLMIADIRKIIEKDPNLSNQERETLSRTLGGGTMQTPGSALRTLNNVLEFVEGKKLTGQSGAPKRINTKDEFDALPRNAIYIDAADGKKYRKP